MGGRIAEFAGGQAEYPGEAFRGVANELGFATLASTRLGGQIRGVGFDEQLFEGNAAGGVG